MRSARAAVTAIMFAERRDDEKASACSIDLCGNHVDVGRHEQERDSRGHPPASARVNAVVLHRRPRASAAARRLRAGEIVVTREEAWKLAEHWIAAWNAHDLDLILAHYEDAIELTSPVAAQLLGTADGKVIGKANLKAYLRRGLEAYPELHFILIDLLLGVSSVVLYYTNQKGTHTAEFMEFSANGKVARVVANYSAPKS